MYQGFWSEIKRFIQVMWCYHFHLTPNQKKIINLNRYVKCETCEGEYLELKYNYSREENKING